MATLPILKYPAPELRKRCDAVTERTDAFAQLVADLIETMESLPGCVGLAAPQVGALWRVVVVDVSRYRKKVESQGRLVLVNPVLKSSSGSKVFREGCLSLPSYTANVTRATFTEFEALDESLQPRTVRARDFESVAIQHEVDHLDGTLFIDRVVCPKTDLFLRKSYL